MKRKGYKPVVTKYKYTIKETKPKRKAPSPQKKLGQSATTTTVRQPIIIAKGPSAKNMQRDTKGRIELKLARGYVVDGSRQVKQGGKLKPLLVPKWSQNRGKTNKALGKETNVKLRIPKKGTRREREIFEEIMDR